MLVLVLVVVDDGVHGGLCGKVWRWSGVGGVGTGSAGGVGADCHAGEAPWSPAGAGPAASTSSAPSVTLLCEEEGC